MKGSEHVGVCCTGRTVNIDSGLVVFMAAGTLCCGGRIDEEEEEEEGERKK